MLEICFANLWPKLVNMCSFVAIELTRRRSPCKNWNVKCKPYIYEHKRYKYYSLHLASSTFRLFQSLQLCVWTLFSFALCVCVFFLFSMKWSVLLLVPRNNKTHCIGNIIYNESWANEFGHSSKWYIKYKSCMNFSASMLYACANVTGNTNWKLKQHKMSIACKRTRWKLSETNGIPNSNHQRLSHSYPLYFDYFALSIN